MRIPRLKRIPLLIFSFEKMQNFGKRFSRLAKFLLKLKPSLISELNGLETDTEAEDYVIASFFSALFYGLVFFFFGYAVSLVLPSSSATKIPILLGGILGLFFFLIFFILHIIYPGILRKKIAVRENKDLLFALQEMTMNIESGITLYDTMRILSIGDYGYVSKDFEKAVKRIAAGEYEKDALKTIAIENENEYVRRAVWQIVNSLETGAKVSSSLSSIIDLLEKQIYREIRDYSANLNFIMLIYMLVAAALPSLGVTFLILLSTFSGAGVSIVTLAAVVAGSTVVQIAIIGYVNTARPDIFR
ncbi:MAG: type II secretion system F family protein [Candidatus Micrarchaeota archaeon]|nr:type II secretion system F family protein [Candidatus Micrarchaeota archaeon]